MISREELKSIAKMRPGKAFYLTLYLNVDPSAHVKNNYLIHTKNMIKQTVENTDKKILKKINADIEKIDLYMRMNKKIFRKGLAILSSTEKNFWREFHLSVPFRNEMIVDSTPYIKPLLDLLDNYQRYAILLVGRDTARIFVVHLGEIEEYTEVRSDNVPGRHKKGGWFALSEKSYERHIDYHVELHLKDVMKKLESFLSHEYVGRLLIGGSSEAVAKVKEMIPQSVSDIIIGVFQADMHAGSKEVLAKAEPILQTFEKKKEQEDIDKLLTRARKNEHAVIGIEDVLNALQEGRIMKLFFMKDFKQSGLSCAKCQHMTTQKIKICPYCKGDMRKVNYIVDLIAQKAIEHGALIEVLSENNKLKRSGNIGAFLRY